MSHYSGGKTKIGPEKVKRSPKKEKKGGHQQQADDGTTPTRTKIGEVGNTVFLPGVEKRGYTTAARSKKTPGGGTVITGQRDVFKKRGNTVSIQRQATKRKKTGCKKRAA